MDNNPTDFDPFLQQSMEGKTHLSNSTEYNLKHYQMDQSTYMDISYKSSPENNMKYDKAIADNDSESVSSTELFKSPLNSPTKQMSTRKTNALQTRSNKYPCSIMDNIVGLKKKKEKYNRFDIVQTLTYKSERDRRLFIRQQRIIYEHYHTLYRICNNTNDFSDKYIYPHFLYIHVMENNIPYTLKNPSSQKKEYF